jgi:hypothetical protein
MQHFFFAQIRNLTTDVNSSPMSPKLLLTYPHREEERGIDLAPLFL